MIKQMNNGYPTSVALLVTFWGSQHNPQVKLNRAMVLGIYKMSDRNMFFHTWALVYLRFKQVSTKSGQYNRFTICKTYGKTSCLIELQDIWHLDTNLFSLTVLTQERFHSSSPRANLYIFSLRLRWNLFSRFWPIHQSITFALLLVLFT